MKSLPTALALVACLLSTSPTNFASAQGSSLDWPHFLGPNKNASAPLAGASFEWSDDEPRVLWDAAVGPGFGGVAIEGGEVFLLDREEGEADVLRVFDLESGEQKWEHAYEAQGRLMFKGSRTVPAVHGDVVVTCGGFGHVTAFSREKKDVLWSESMAETYGGEMPMFGWAAAPLMVGDTVVCTALGEEVGLVAFDAKTGDEVWVTEPVGYSHSTPTLMNFFGKQQIVFLWNAMQGSGTDEAAAMQISSFDPATGEKLWQTEIELTRLPIPGPVQIDENRFFVTGGYRGGSSMVRIDEGENGYDFEVLFHIERGAQIHNPILFEDHLYVIVNENWNNDQRSRRTEGGLMCLTLDGKELWRTADSPFFGRGNLMLVGDHLLVQDGFDGTLHAIRPSPDAYDEVARANPFGIDDRADHQMWAPMALSGNRLLMRSQEALLCVEL